jgi:hypothetical protein
VHPHFETVIKTRAGDEAGEPASSWLDQWCPELIFSVVVGVEFGSGLGMLVGMKLMAMRGVGMVGRRVDIIFLMTFGGFAVMVGGFFVVGRRGFVMVYDLIGVGHDERSGLSYGQFFRAGTLRTVRVRTGFVR